MRKRSRSHPRLEAAAAVIGTTVVVAIGFASLAPTVDMGADNQIARGSLTPELSRFVDDAQKMPVRLTTDPLSGEVISITLDDTSESTRSKKLDRSADDLAAQAFGFMRDPVQALLQSPVLVMESDLVTGRILSVTRVNQSPNGLGQSNWFD